MRPKLLAVTALVASGVIAAAFFVQSLSSSSAQTQTRSRYLPEYDASGDLLLPKNFHEWVYVGSPLTPNALNGGRAGFPEYHNVYIEPGSYAIFNQTNEFPEGQSCSRSYNSRCRLRTPTVHEPSHRAGAFSPDLSTVPM